MQKNEQASAKVSLCENGIVISLQGKLMKKVLMNQIVTSVIKVPVKVKSVVKTMTQGKRLESNSDEQGLEW